MSKEVAFKELGGYGRLEPWMIMDKRLTWTERAILALVAQGTETKGSCHMGVRAIARTLGMSPATVADSLEALGMARYIKFSGRDDCRIVRSEGTPSNRWMPWYHSLSCVLPHKWFEQAVLCYLLYRDRHKQVGPVTHGQVARLYQVSRSQAQDARRDLISRGIITYNPVTGPHVRRKVIVQAMAHEPSQVTAHPEPRIMPELGEYGRLEPWMLDVWGLTWAQRAVLAHMAGRTEAMGACRSSVRAIMRDLGMSQLTVQGAIDELSGRGLIERHGRDWRVVRPKDADVSEWWPWYHSFSLVVPHKWFEQAVLCHLLYLDANGISGHVSHSELACTFRVRRSQAQRARDILAGSGVLDGDHVRTETIVEAASGCGIVLGLKGVSLSLTDRKREDAPRNPAVQYVTVSARTGLLVETGRLRHDGTKTCRDKRRRVRSFVRNESFGEEVEEVPICTEEPWASKAREYMKTHAFPFTVEGAKRHPLVDLSDDEPAVEPAAPLPKARPEAPVRPQLTYGEQLALSLDVLDGLDDDDIPY